MIEPFQLNIEAVNNLVSSRENKTVGGNSSDDIGALEDTYALDMKDEELLELDKNWRTKYSPYEAKITPRQKRNKKYYTGILNEDDNAPTSSNVIFESQETFIPQALAQNPEPVVYSDNTEEGKQASDAVKTMLRYHADELVLNKVLGVMLRHWSIYFIGIVKHGWDKKANDITLKVRNPKNFMFDPEGYIDAKGCFVGEFLGEKIPSTAKELIALFPDKKDFITVSVAGKLGTQCIRTEWWTDEFCFTTFNGEVLEKHKNEFFNYGTEEAGIDEDGEETIVKKDGINHFSHPQMPYTFLSIFSLQETPHDMTNLIEQNIKNQERISDRDNQVDKNLRSGNNSLIIDPNYADQETAREVAQAVENGDPVLVDPKGVTRIPASALPSGILEAQEVAKDSLRATFGVQGLSTDRQTTDTTARGQILNQSHDATRIGGGVGSALEQVADSIFNFQLQMYYVFYDEPHYAAVLGTGAAVNYIQLEMSDPKRQFVVTVMPDSMTPKDEITEQNQAINLANSGWLDPINLYKKLNDPNPMETAKMVTLFKVSPELYMQTFFPENQPVIGPGANPNPLNMPPVQPQGEGSLGAPPASPALSQVPLEPTGASLPK